jgi:hypothetical protein
MPSWYVQGDFTVSIFLLCYIDFLIDQACWCSSNGRCPRQISDETPLPDRRVCGFLLTPARQMLGECQWHRYLPCPQFDNHSPSNSMIEAPTTHYHGLLPDLITGKKSTAFCQENKMQAEKTCNKFEYSVGLGAPLIHGALLHLRVWGPYLCHCIVC